MRHIGFFGKKTNFANTFVDYLNYQLSTLIAGKTAPVYAGAINGAGGTVTASTTISDIFVSGGRNTNGWWGNMDLTCIPQSIGNNGVLITPRDMFFAQHWTPGNGTVVTFMDNNGIQHTGTIASSMQIGSTDLLVATLTADIPSSITPAKLLPSNWRSYINFNNLNYTCIFTNQDRRLLIGMTTTAEDVGSEFFLDQSSNSLFAPWYYPVRSYDSGSPAFMYINGQLVNLTNWHDIYTVSSNSVITYEESGPDDADNISAINAALTTMGSPYQVSTISLSGL